jgi:deoxyxylulose-5-phosphate synthase
MVNAYFKHNLSAHLDLKLLNPFVWIYHVFLHKTSKQVLHDLYAGVDFQLGPFAFDL